MHFLPNQSKPVTSYHIQKNCQGLIPQESFGSKVVIYCNSLLAICWDIAQKTLSPPVPEAPVVISESLLLYCPSVEGSPGRLSRPCPPDPGGQRTAADSVIRACAVPIAVESPRRGPTTLMLVPQGPWLQMCNPSIVPPRDGSPAQQGGLGNYMTTHNPLETQ